jgi:hypothetical protein
MLSACDRHKSPIANGNATADAPANTGDFSPASTTGAEAYCLEKSSLLRDSIDRVTMWKRVRHYQICDPTPEMEAKVLDQLIELNDTKAMFERALQIHGQNDPLTKDRALQLMKRSADGGHEPARRALESYGRSGIF